MNDTRQTNIRSRIRAQHIVGRVAAVIGFGIFIYGVASTGLVSSLIITKPNFYRPPER